MTEQQSFSPDDELDLSGEGLQPTDGLFLISNPRVEEHAEGQRWMFDLEVQGDEIPGLPNQKARDSGFLAHRSRPELAKMGKGTLKRIFKEVLGTDRARLQDLEGKLVRAQVSEDDNGYSRVRRYKAYETE